MSAENILKVPFSKPSISEEEEKAVIEVIRSGWLTTGKVTLEFEKEFSDFMNSTLDDEKQKVISLAVNSNTSGIKAAIQRINAAIGDANQFTNTDATPQATVKGMNPIKPCLCSVNSSISVLLQ